MPKTLEKIVKLTLSDDGTRVHIRDRDNRVGLTRLLDGRYNEALAGRERCYMYATEWGGTLVLDGTVMQEHEPEW